MTADRRMKNRNWTPADENGLVPTWERVNLAVLLDIRDELQRLNAAIYCPNFTAIPAMLRAIRRNTTKKRAKK
jgi:hypothetical protein